MEAWWDKVVAWWDAAGVVEHTLLVVTVSLLIYGCFRVWGLRRLQQVAVATSNDVDDRLVDFTRQFFGLVLFAVTGLVVLRLNDVEITPFLAGAGIAGVALGLAAKETLSDVLAGIFLIADRPMRVGDRIKLDSIGEQWGAWGDVMDIGLRRTVMRNTDGVTVSYPNSMLANSVIINFSREPGPVRVRVRFVVDHSADLDAVIAVAGEAIGQTPGVLAPTVAVVVRSLWDEKAGHMTSGVLMEGRYQIANVRERTVIRSEVLKHVAQALRASEIPMAVPRIETRPAP